MRFQKCPSAEQKCSIFSARVCLVENKLTYNHAKAVITYLHGRVRVGRRGEEPNWEDDEGGDVQIVGKKWGLHDEKWEEEGGEEREWPCGGQINGHIVIYMTSCIIDKGIISCREWSSLAIISRLFWHAAMDTGDEDKSVLPIYIQPKGPSPSHRGQIWKAAIEQNLVRAVLSVIWISWYKMPQRCLTCSSSHILQKGERSNKLLCLYSTHSYILYCIQHSTDDG